MGGACFSLDSVGINRREVVNERVIQERSSDHPDPEPCEGDRKGALEALEKKHLAEPPDRGVRKPGQGHMQAGYPEIVSSEIAEIREPTDPKTVGHRKI